MDYDDNDFQGQNLNLAGEGSLKFSPVLRPYAIPKFDFDDSLQGHLRFDSLVENEVFLGIPSQDDNQWIEDFSRGSSGIEFDSGATESCSISRHNNVWSEATSSESVEMLLKSVGQEERVVGETIIEEAYAGDDLGNLTNPMESNFKQDEGNNHAHSASAPDVHLSDVGVDPNLHSEEVELFSCELGSNIVSGTFEEKNELNGDDVNQGVIDNVVNETVNNEIPDPSVCKSECGNAHPSEDLNDQDNQQQVSEIGVRNVPEGVWRSVEKHDIMDTRAHMGVTDTQITEIGISDVEVPTGSHLKEGYEPNVTDGFSVDVSLHEPSLISKREVTLTCNLPEINQQVADDTPLESTVVIPGNEGSGMHATEVDNTSTDIATHPELEISSIVQTTDVQSYSVVEKENATGNDDEEDTGALVSSSATSMLSVSGDKWLERGDVSSTGHVSDSTILVTAYSSADVVAGKTLTENLKVERNAHEVVQEESNAKDHGVPPIFFDSVQIHQENPSFELDEVHMDQDVSVQESGSAKLSKELIDMECEVVGVLDSPKKPVSMSSGETSGNVVVAQGSDSHTTTETEPATKETKFESQEPLDAHEVPSGIDSTNDIDIGHDDQPKSPILGVSHQLPDDKGGMDVDVPREASPLHGASQTSTIPDPVSESPTFEVKECTSAEYAGKVQHEIDDQCASGVRVSQSEQAPVAIEVVQVGSKVMEASSTPCGSIIKEGAETEISEETKTEINELVQNLPDNSSNDHQASVDSILPSKCDADHVVQEEGNSVILDKHGCDSPTVISCVELSHNAKDNCELGKDTIQENISRSEVTDNVEEKIQSISHNLCENGSPKEEMSFSFEVSPSVSLGDAAKVWQSFPTIQASNLPTIAEGSASKSVAPQVDPKITQEVTQCSPQIPVGGITKGGAKGTTERKARRKSGGKESAKKGINVKETSAKQSERSEKLSVSLATAGTGTVLQFEELKSYESVELDAKKPSGVVSIPASSVPDLNTSVSLSQQPFTDMQQVQLRAQILVYGSLIQGTTPDEACMIAAFGPSVGGRSPWEPVWRASIERLHGRKSMGNKIDTPVQSRSGITTPDQAVKHGSVKSKGPSSTTGRGKKKGPGTPSPVLSPMIPLSSPLWSISTPSAEGLQAGSITRGAHLDYHQSLSPLHPYQTPPIQNFAGHNPSWLPHGPFPGQWVAAPPTSPFNVSGRMSTLPTEAVKLTPVKESDVPDINRAPIPVVYSSGSSVFAGASPLPDLKISTVSSVLPIGNSKSRKRKKVSSTETVGQIALPGQTQTKLVSAPVIIGDLPKKVESLGQISLPAQSRTDSVSVPVVSSIFSTAVAVSTTASFNSKNTPEKFPSSLTPTPSNDQPKSGNKNAEEKVEVLPISDSKSRKRKKVPTIEPVGQIALPGQTQTQLVSTPVIIGDLSKKAESRGQNSLLAQSWTELVSVPVSSSIFSTPVAVSTSASFNSKFTPEKFPFTVTPTPPNDQPKSGDQNAEEKVIVLPIGDSKSRKRKKVPTTEPIGQISLPGQTQTKLVSAPVIIGELSKKVESHGQISMLAQSGTESAVPVVSSIFSTSVVVSTTANNSKSTPEKYPSALTSAPSNHQSISGDQNAEGKVIVSEEAFNKVEEAKVLAEEAAKDAASAISSCQGVWSQLEKQKNSGLVSDAEVKLASAAVSIAAAASVAKAAAAAAKIASNAAEQARLMAYEVLASSGSGDFSQSCIISLPNDVNNYGKATPASILKGGDGSSQSSSIIVAAREASRRRVEAASAAAKHAENIDAIVKAAELAAEAVSQAGKIVAMGEPLPLSELVASGPEGYWKTPQLTSEQQCVTTGNVTSHKSSTMSAAADSNISARPSPSDMEIKTLRHDEVSGDLIKDPVRGVANPILVSKTIHEKDLGGLRSHKAADISKTIGVVPESEFGLSNASVSVQNEHKNSSGILEENIIKEGCLVEVFKDGGKFKGAWFAANVLNFRDGKAYLCYTELESDEGKLKEWVALEGDGTKVPRIRIAHPMTTMKFDGTRKRRRGAVTDYSWNVGDRVDAWLHTCWCEGLVTEKDKNDETSLSVHFPAQGETSVVRAWHLRPTLIWKDAKWIEWSSSKGNHSSQGDTPKEKRIKLGYPSPELRGKQKVQLDFIPEEKSPKLDGHTVEGEGKDRSQTSVDHAALGKHEEARILPLSAHEKVFNVGTKVEKKLELHRTVRSGLQKEGPRVIFGVPKPGKKQKFMDVSKHYNGDRGNKNDSANVPSKFTRYLMPQGTGPRGWTNNFKNDNKEKQTVERKPRVFKTGKAAQIPSGRTLASNDNNLSSAKFVPKGTTVTDNVVKNAASNDLNESGEQNLLAFKSSSNTEDTSEGPLLVSSHAPPADAPKRVISSKARSERSNRGRLAPADGKSAKQEVTDKSGPEVAEPRRSNRRIQPTSRLLEGLQSSLTISKIPAISHDRSHRGQNKATPKGR